MSVCKPNILIYLLSQLCERGHTHIRAHTHICTHAHTHTHCIVAVGSALDSCLCLRVCEVLHHLLCVG